jgi:hypothetical protein
MSLKLETETPDAFTASRDISRTRGAMERKAATHQGSRERAPRPQGADEAIRASEAAERIELVESLLEALEARGVPQGAWLVDINRIRQALQEADGLLRRLEDAIIRAASSPSRPE